MVGNGRRKQPIWVPPTIISDCQANQKETKKTKQTTISARQFWRELKAKKKEHGHYLVQANMKKQKSFRRASTLSEGIEKSFLATRKRLPVSTNDNLLSPPNHSYLWHCPIGTLNTGQIWINFTKKSKNKILKETLLSFPTYSSH